MAASTIDFKTIDGLTNKKLGVFDVCCPLCSDGRHTAANRRAKVLRIWRTEATFGSYFCAHCDASGYAFDGNSPPPDEEKLKAAKAEAAERAKKNREDRQGLARWLWGQSRPARGSPVERYLASRGITMPAPPTIRYLPARGTHVHAMIAAFALPVMDGGGVLAPPLNDVMAVHITRLRADGRGKAGSSKDKQFVASPKGFPIALAAGTKERPSLAIGEGIEDGLSAAEAMGCAAWAAGSAGSLPALAPVVPDFYEMVFVTVDDDPAGRKGSYSLADALYRRGFDVRLVEAQHDGRHGSKASDCNDLLQKEGVGAVRKRFEQARGNGYAEPNPVMNRMRPGLLRAKAVGLVQFVLEGAQGEHRRRLYWAGCKVAELDAAGAFYQGLTRNDLLNSLLSAALSVGLKANESRLTLRSALSSDRRAAA